MDTQRRVHRMHSVFDIFNFRSILLPQRSCIRILFEYDEETEKRNFTVLTRDIPEDMRNLLARMLQENISTDKIIYGLNSNNLDYNELTFGGRHGEDNTINFRSGEGQVPFTMSETAVSGV